MKRKQPNPSPTAPSTPGGGEGGMEEGGRKREEEQDEKEEKTFFVPPPLRQVRAESTPRRRRRGRSRFEARGGRNQANLQRSPLSEGGDRSRVNDLRGVKNQYPRRHDRSPEAPKDFRRSRISPEVPEGFRRPPEASRGPKRVKTSTDYYPRSCFVSHLPQTGANPGLRCRDRLVNTESPDLSTPSLPWGGLFSLVFFGGPRAREQPPGGLTVRQGSVLIFF